MPVNFTNFLSAESFTTEDFFVGYRSTPSPGQEKRWTFKDVGTPPADDLPDTPPNRGGSDSTFFIMADGTLRFCGKNTDWHGGIGDVKSDVVNIPRPCAFSPTLQVGEKVVKVYQQFTSSFAVTNSGNVYGAGTNGDYQLGLGTNANIPVYTRILKSTNDSLDSCPHLSGDKVEELSTGSGAGCRLITVFARTSAGKLWVWGYNGKTLERAGIGNTTDTYITLPTYVAPGSNFVEPIVQITGAGWAQTISNSLVGAQVHAALGANGKLYTIGEGVTGAAGTGLSTVDHKRFTVPSGLTSINDIKSVTCGGESGNISTWVITNGGDVYASGKNDDKQVDPSSASTKIYQFKKITSLSNVSKLVMHADTNNTTIWALGGAQGEFTSIVGWGDNSSGQLGNGSITAQATPSTPAFFTLLFSAGKKIKDIIVGGNDGKKYTAFIDSSNDVWAAGYNGTGLLGNGKTSATLAYRNTFDRCLVPKNYGNPKKLLGGANGVSTNSTPRAFIMCLMNTGKVLAWGYDATAVGQLAVDTSPNITPIPSPVFLLF